MHPLNDLISVAGEYIVDISMYKLFHKRLNSKLGTKKS